MIRARLIVDPPLPAAVNMARDEAVLAAVDAGAAPATLRFYRWQPAAVSLGYFQPIEEYDRRPDVQPMDMVRRLTGGGAILHADELTYSLTVPADLAALTGTPTKLYELAHQAIIDALGRLGMPVRFHDGPGEGNAQRGPFFCFARRHRYDLLVGPDKIVGSAQRRRARTILQHGSIIMTRVEPQPCTGINDHLARPLGVGELIEALIEPLSWRLGIKPRLDEYTGEELAEARRLHARYAGDDWNRRR